jgi:hypothetical protein
MRGNHQRKPNYLYKRLRTIPEHSTEMDICLEMVISYLFLFLAFIIDQNVSAEESRCGAHGPTIRFPFRLNSQPKNDGYPGFTLSCTHTNQTMLELPISVKLFVKEIDYKSQVIQLYDPHHCFPRGLRGLDLSSSHFQFKLDLYDYALFNCSPRETTYHSAISCLGGPNYKVFALWLGPDEYNMSLGLLHCTKMYTLRSMPYDVIVLNPEKFLQLKWSTPACRQYCEVKGMRCTKSNGSRSGTECISKGILSIQLILHH